MGPQAAGGVAQVGRSWEGDRRGKRDREVGWRQTWRDRERHLHRERHRQRDGEITHAGVRCVLHKCGSDH